METVMVRLTSTLITIAAAAALAGTGAGAALAAASAPPAAAASTAPRCYTQDLSASLHGGEGAVAGREGVIMTLTNDGQRSCSLYGYPGLGLQDGNDYT